MTEIVYPMRLFFDHSIKSNKFQSPESLQLWYHTRIIFKCLVIIIQFDTHIFLFLYFYYFYLKFTWVMFSKIMRVEKKTPTTTRPDNINMNLLCTRNLFRRTTVVPDTVITRQKHWAPLSSYRYNIL